MQIDEVNFSIQMLGFFKFCSSNTVIRFLNILSESEKLQIFVCWDLKMKILDIVAIFDILKQSKLKKLWFECNSASGEFCGSNFWIFQIL